MLSYLDFSKICCLSSSLGRRHFDYGLQEIVRVSPAFAGLSFPLCGFCDKRVSWSRDIPTLLRTVQNCKFRCYSGSVATEDFAHSERKLTSLVQGAMFNFICFFLIQFNRCFKLFVIVGVFLIRKILTWNRKLFGDFISIVH